MSISRLTVRPVKKLVFLAALGILSMPAVMANAQQPSEAEMQRMQAIPGQIEALHKRAHALMMAAITPQHRALVAKLKASHMNSDAAAKKIDAALTPRELKAVMAIDSKRRADEHALVAKGGGGIMLQENGKPDAGELLLDEQHLQLMTPQ